MVSIPVIEQWIPAPPLSPEGRGLVMLACATLALAYLGRIHLA